MATTRKIKEAKDLSSGELIYFKGHAKATYMSDGSTVEDSINQLKNNIGSGSNVDLSDYETKAESQDKLQEAKDYTDSQITDLREGIITQIININEGWNWVSFYVDTLEGESGLTLLQDALGDKVTQIKNQNGFVYIENGIWEGNITTIDLTSMYMIYAIEPITISFTGKKINPSYYPITINKTWTWLGYLLTEPMSVKDALINLQPSDGDIIKRLDDVFIQYIEGVGWVEEDESNNIFNTLNPGVGYQYYNYTQEEKSFTYPSDTISKADLDKKQDILVSGENIKTVNGESLLGNGDLEIQGLKTYTFEYDDNNNSFEKLVTISQEELNKVLESDKIYIKNGDILVEVTVKEESDISLYLRGYANDVDVNKYTIIIDKSDLTYWIHFRHYSLLTNEDLSINYGSVSIPYIEDGLILEEQYIPVENVESITVLTVFNEELDYVNHLYASVSDYVGDYIVFYGKYTDTSLLKATYNKENQTITFNIIEQSGDNNSSGGSYALVEHGTNDTTFMLTPNTFHVWGEVASLTLTLGSEQSGVSNEYLFQFESGNEATTLALPDSIVWSNGDTPVIESKCTYQISILNGFAAIMKFKKKEIVISEFTIKIYEGVFAENIYSETYSYEVGMTWGDWVDSEYNTNGYYFIDENGSVYNTNVDMSPSGDPSVKIEGYFVSSEDLIDNELYYMID